MAIGVPQRANIERHKTCWQTNYGQAMPKRIYAELEAIVTFNWNGIIR